LNLSYFRQYVTPVLEIRATKGVFGRMKGILEAKTKKQDKIFNIESLNLACFGDKHHGDTEPLFIPVLAQCIKSSRRQSSDSGVTWSLLKNSKVG
jgi:hypothetical protein